jgi:hypothetical protein
MSTLTLQMYCGLHSVELIITREIPPIQVHHQQIFGTNVKIMES